MDDCIYMPVSLHSGRKEPSMHHRLCTALLVLLLCLLPAGLAVAEVLSLPTSLVTVDQQAFLGCTNVTEVRIPDSVTSIGEDAIPEGVTILCHSGTYAYDWAVQHGYDVQTEKRYFALLIGQSYASTPTLATLPGCIHDARSMQAMLKSMPATPYRITVKTDLSASGILSAIPEAFSGAQPGDVCLFYYSGHGADSNIQSMVGALMGTDNGNYVLLSDLRQKLDTIPADKVIIMDSCYSGNLLNYVNSARTLSETEPVHPDLDRINSAVISAFSTRARSAGSGDYYVITAASEYETSYDHTDARSGVSYGVFTMHLLKGCGYNEISGAVTSTMPADKNGDHALSVNEAYAYGYTQTLMFFEDSIYAPSHAQISPMGASFVFASRADD